mmetsp:Transcript_3034/g.5084  ORF Transcript_3034/g.5084 Transcript_3034/m.5084 type:complete len:367 (-) Transcript_3034:209-1309(-)
MPLVGRAMKDFREKPSHQNHALLFHRLEGIVSQGHYGFDIELHERGHHRSEFPGMLVDCRDAALVDFPKRLARDLAPGADIGAGRTPGRWGDEEIPQNGRLLSSLPKKLCHARHRLERRKHEYCVPDTRERFVCQESRIFPVFFPPSQYSRPLLPRLAKHGERRRDRRQQRFHFHRALLRELLKLRSIPKELGARYRDERFLFLEREEHAIECPESQPLLSEAEGLLGIRRDVEELAQKIRPLGWEVVPSDASNEHKQLRDDPLLRLIEEQRQKPAFHAFLLSVRNESPFSLFDESSPEGARGRPVPRAPHHVLRHDCCVNTQVNLALVFRANYFEKGRQHPRHALLLPVFQHSKRRVSSYRVARH